MNESLRAACGQFEQLLVGQMLRTADTSGRFRIDEDEDAASQQDDRSAFDQLLEQALSLALERAGGIGLSRSLFAALRGRAS